MAGRGDSRGIEPPIQAIGGSPLLVNFSTGSNARRENFFDQLLRKVLHTKAKCKELSGDRRQVRFGLLFAAGNGSLTNVPEETGLVGACLGTLVRMRAGKPDVPVCAGCREQPVAGLKPPGLLAASFRCGLFCNGAEMG